MLMLIVFLSCLLAAIGTGILASLSDLKGLTIPNICSLVIIGVFVFCYLILWAGGRDDVFSPLLSHILAALIVFVATAVLFALRIMGGGDSKMATSYALWMGLPGLMPFLFYMTLAGGLLALAAIIFKKWTPVKNPKPSGWIARVQAGESKVPYGIAIIVGALASFWNLGYFDLDTFRSFLGA